MENTEHVTHDIQAWARVAKELGLSAIRHPLGTEVLIFNSYKRNIFLLITQYTMSAGEEDSERFVPTTAAEAFALMGRMIKKD